MYIDTHCHLYPEFGFVTKTPDEIVSECILNRITEMWLAGTEKADILWNLEFCKKYPKNLKTWVGWHPEQYLSYDEKFLVSILEKQSGFQNPKSKIQITNEKLPDAEILRFAKNENNLIVGIGEIGLDFAAHPKSTKLDQITVFESQLKIAQKYSLPVAIHSRDAFEETLKVMEKYNNLKYLWHCFTLSKDKTKVIFEKFPQIYIGLNAILTYKSGDYIKESLSVVPKDKILIETDSPFLAPRPFKYLFNTPEGVRKVYEAVSEVLEIPLVKLTEKIKQNCKNLFYV